MQSRYQALSKYVNSIKECSDESQFYLDLLRQVLIESPVLFRHAIRLVLQDQLSGPIDGAALCLNVLHDVAMTLGDDCIELFISLVVSNMGSAWAARDMSTQYEPNNVSHLLSKMSWYNQILLSRSMVSAADPMVDMKHKVLVAQMLERSIPGARRFLSKSQETLTLEECVMRTRLAGAIIELHALVATLLPKLSVEATAQLDDCLLLASAATASSPPPRAAPRRKPPSPRATLLSLFHPEDANGGSDVALHAARLGPRSDAPALPPLGAAAMRELATALGRDSPPPQQRPAARSSAGDAPSTLPEITVCIVSPLPAV